MSCGSGESAEDLSAQDCNVRKRVGKACDRCRLKKSKCDGTKPCSRCRTDNQVCLFGERKKTHDKIYPKGYVELLEHQQSLLVSALQSVYKQYWTGPPMPEVEGFPSVHDLLEHLGLLQEDNANSPMSMDGFHFEEDLVKMQVRLAATDGLRNSASRQSLSPPMLSPVSSQPSLFPDSFSPMQPATPQDQRNFVNINAPLATSSFPFSHISASLPTEALTFQTFDQMKLTGTPFQPSIANGTRTGDFENMDAFSTTYPLMSTYGELGDFVDEDSFGTFVDLGASSETIR